MSDNKRLEFLAIIPARNGSKRFPGKNLFPLLGEPLLSYPIRAAKQTRLIDRILVSTDDPEISLAAKSYGADVPFLRPPEMAKDNSPVIDAIVFTLQKLKEIEYYKPDYIVLLQPVNPLINKDQIEKAINLVLKHKADSVISITPVDTTSHPYNLRTVNDDGFVNFWLNDLHYSYIGKRKPEFYKIANLIVSSYETIMEEHKFEGKRNYPLIVDSLSAHDIDYKHDLELIEAYLKYAKH